MRCWLIAGLWLAALCKTEALAEEPVQFQRDIRPILSQHCFKCHGPALQEAGLRLDERDRATRRKVIVPGKPAESKLLTRVSRADEERMPPPDVGEHLKPAQIALLQKWIAQGAEYTPHWAFIRPKQAPLPKVHGVMAAQSDRPFHPRAAGKGGLETVAGSGPGHAHPPAVARSARPAADAEGSRWISSAITEPDAYEKLVDRLLGSPHYGERQARHWLDLARYADSNGYTIDGKRSIWP